MRPTRELGRATLNAPLFGLAPGGVFLATGVATGTGELLPHLFTLTVGVPRRSGLCGTFRGVTPPGYYPAPCPVEPGLSSSCAGRSQRSPGLLRVRTSYMLPFSPVSVNGLAGQTVGLVIERPVQVGNSIDVKLLQRLVRFPPEGKKVRRFHPVGAFELLHHQ